MAVFKRFDHVSIGVKDMEKARKLFTEVLGAVPMKDKGESPEGFDWVTFMLGGSKVELVSPHKLGEGGVGRYIEKYGEGFHHISIAVDDIAEAIRHFESKGVRVLGAQLEENSWKHCYLHPKDTFGALIQVFEESEKTVDDAGALDEKE